MLDTFLFLLRSIVALELRDGEIINFVVQRSYMTQKLKFYFFKHSNGSKQRYEPWISIKGLPSLKDSQAQAGIPVKQCLKLPCLN